MKLKDKVLVIQEAYEKLDDTSCRIIVGEVINAPISVDNQFAITDSNGENPYVIELLEIFNNRKFVGKANMGEAVKLTIRTFGNTVEENMLLYKCKTRILDVIFKGLTIL